MSYMSDEQVREAHPMLAKALEPDVFDEELGLVVTKHRPNCGGECIEAGCTIEPVSDSGEDT